MEKVRKMNRKQGFYARGMYERIPQVIQGKDILEVATGPGLLAKHVSDAVHKMIATDYSDGVIQEAKEGSYSDNLTFEVADAEHLPYNDTLQTKADTVRCRPSFQS